MNMSNQEYIDVDGSRCPNCRSSNIEANQDFDGCSQEAKCHDCGASWVDCYNLVGYTELEVSDKKV